MHHFCFLFIFTIFISCQSPQKEIKPTNKAKSSRTFKEIQEKGTLKVFLDNSPTSYFIYKGVPMGYEFELLNWFSRDNNLHLDIEAVYNMDSLLYYIQNGKADLAAANLTITNERKKIVQFTLPHLQTKQVLIQKLPKNFRILKHHEIESRLIRELNQLEGKKVVVRKNSSFYKRLLNLQDELGVKINIIEADGNMETEELIEQVSEGNIDFTVADENIALLNKHFHSNIDVQTAISFTQNIGWATNKKDTALTNRLNEWITKAKKSNDFYTIRNKYFKAHKSFAKKAKSEFSSIKGGRISKYDELIKKYAKSINLDWRLLAAQIYQESKFVVDAESWTGAKGLMQIIPNTAKEFEIENIVDPEENIKGGTKYLEWLNSIWKEKIKSPTERTKFILASYNVGIGHVLDAREIARTLGKPDSIWFDNVAECILLKSKPEYFNLPGIKHGYCRGTEPYQYVQEIFIRYQHYCSNIELL